MCTCRRRRRLFVRLGSEPGNGPGHLAQEVHDGGDVEELDPQRTGPQLDDLEAGALRRGLGARSGLPARVDRPRPHQEGGQLAVGAGADLLGEVRPAGPQDPGDLVPQHHDGVPADHEVEGRDRRRAASAASATATTWRAERAQSSRATATLGGHDSVATSSGGGRSTDAPAPPRRPFRRRARQRRPPSAPPSAGRSPRAAAPRSPARRTRRSPSPRPGRLRPPRREPRRSRTEALVDGVDECPIARALPARDHVVHDVPKGQAGFGIGEADRAAGTEVPETVRVRAEGATWHRRLEAEAERHLLVEDRAIALRLRCG